MSFVVI